MNHLSRKLSNLLAVVIVVAAGVVILVLMWSFTSTQQTATWETPTIRAETRVNPTSSSISILTPTEGVSASQEATTAPTPESTPEGTPTAEVTPSPNPTTPIRRTVFISDEVPGEFRSAIEAAVDQSSDYYELTDSASADLTVTSRAGEDATLLAYRVFVPVARFPTMQNTLSLDELKSFWQGQPQGDTSLYMTNDTREVMVALWGPPAPDAHLQVVPAAELVDRLWQDSASIAVVPFPQLEPRLKVLAVDGQRATDNRLPLGDDGVPTDYGLTLRVVITGPEKERFFLRDKLLTVLPYTNRDPDRLTGLAMTGVTAMARVTAVRMEAYGDFAYPAHKVGQVLSAADITHISNEVPFVPGCVADGSENNLILCSKPEYFAALEEVGIDIVGLSGNHMADFGDEMFLWSLDYYREKGVPYYAGGKDAEEATESLLITHSNNRLAFLGANQWGPLDNWATEAHPGSARYDADGMASTIGSLKEGRQADIVSVELQWEEAYQTEPLPAQVVDFRALAEAGADIVTGVQSHVAQAIEFHAGNIILYGLGNLFFDQMWSLETRQALIAWHTFYDGRHISTDLLVTVLEDYSQPRWATEAEREEVLTRVFVASGWQTEDQKQ